MSPHPALTPADAPLTTLGPPQPPPEPPTFVHLGDAARRRGLTSWAALDTFLAADGRVRGDVSPRAGRAMRGPKPGYSAYTLVAITLTTSPAGMPLVRRERHRRSNPPPTPRDGTQSDCVGGNKKSFDSWT